MEVHVNLKLKIMKKFSLFFLVLVSFGLMNSQTYCIPSFAFGCAAIDDFEISASGNSPDFSHLGSHCSVNEYQYFSSMPISLQAGVSHPYKIKHLFSTTWSSATKFVRIWIDFNNDGVFDNFAPEMIAANSAGSSSQMGNGNSFATTIGNIIIPVNVIPGNYRMRVSNKINSQASPCNTDGYGEIHDYPITISGAPSCLSPTIFNVSNITEHSATLNWSAPQTSPASGYEFYYSATNMPPTNSGTPTNNASVNISSLAGNTTYYFWVRSVCSTTNLGYWTAGPSFTTLPYCTNITLPIDNAVDQSLNPTISWEAVTNSLGYKITVGTSQNSGDILNNVDLGNVTSYTFSNPLQSGTQYFYKVRAYNSNVTNSICPERTFTTVCNGYPVNSTYTNKFSIFPGTCWSVAQGGNTTTGPEPGTIQFNWRSNYFLQPGNATSGNTAAAFNLHFQNRKGWLISPVFNLAGASYTLTFKYGITAFSSTNSSPMGSDDVVHVLISYDGGISWNIIETFSNADNIDNSSHLFSHYIPVASNQTMFAIYASDGTVNDPVDYLFHVDNFSVKFDVSLASTEINQQEDEVLIYPNPVKDVLHISNAKNVSKIEVFDLSGRLVKGLHKPSNSLDLSDLKSGMYILVAYTENEKPQSFKIIKK